jgi:hypothetical protein
MFLDRRSLLQSAAALLVPSTAATALKASAVNPELEQAVERYIEAFAAFYGKPYRPDAATKEAHDRAENDRDCRKNAFESARDELMRLAMAHHGMDSEKESTDFPALSVDVGEITAAVGADIDPYNDTSPLGRDTLFLIPRTDAARARLAAIKTFDPWAFENEEEAERLGLRGNPRNEGLGFDPARMPADEPVPVKVDRCDYGDGEERYTAINRTWTPDGAMACNRCKLCVFDGLTIDRLGKSPSCQVEVWPDDAELVLYGPTPPAKDEQYPNDLMVDTSWDWSERDVIGTKPARLEVLVMSRTAWEADPRSKDDEWMIAEGRRGTRGNLVAVARKLTGPQPRILEQSTA